MALLNNLEHEELVGGLRSFHLRLPLALLTTALLYLAGDMVGAWPLAWVALVPLCFACRGAGPLCALLLAGVSFLAAAVFQSFWLLDVEGVAPGLVWVLAGAMPAVPFLAIELPICRKIPWMLRPPLLVLLSAAYWALLPRDARMLIPTGGLIDSELIRLLYTRIGLASLAGIMTGFGWLCAEMFTTPRLREPKRSGWPGLVLAGVLVVAGGIDWIGSLGRSAVNANDRIRIYVVTAEDDLVGATDEVLGDASGGFVVWRQIRIKDAAEQVDWLARAGEVAQRRGVGLAMVLAGPDATTAYIFLAGPDPVLHRKWHGERGEVRGEPLVIENLFQLRIYPSLESNDHYSTRWSIEIYTTPLEPVAPAQERFWVREQRREAMIRGSRQIGIWATGGVAVDGVGEVLASDQDADSFAVLLPAGAETGEALGRPRQLFIEDILVFSGPALVGMLLLLTPVSWAKRRYLARRRTAGLSLAIEEIANEETTLTKEETEKITRSYLRKK